TRNLLFTKQLLCQLSYVGKSGTAKCCASGEYTDRVAFQSTAQHSPIRPFRRTTSTESVIRS
ncbi:MAG TPA: hypothetical protein PK691_11925, partial [Thermomicrobiales bacterium]|nr:hypothetical protein [Thermomicrobiales bacterium]